MSRSKTIELAFPIELPDQAPIKEICVVRPRWKHVRKFLASSSPFEEDNAHLLANMDVDKIMRFQEVQTDALHGMIRDLSQLNDEQMDELDPTDVVAISEYLESFIKKFQATGRK